MRDGVTYFEKSVTNEEKTVGKSQFGTVDIALVSVFCALWVVLNITLGPLSFTLLGLPVLHDFAVFFTLLLVAWATGKFGTASLVGIIGSIFASFLINPLIMIGFVVSAVLFDIIMIANNHKLSMKVYNMTIAALATMASAYFAGVVIGVFAMNGSFQWALTFWGVWHLVGGIVSVAVTLPLIAILEKANVRRIKIV
jgi:hypothetical protein